IRPISGPISPAAWDWMGCRPPASGPPPPRSWRSTSPTSRPPGGHGSRCTARGPWSRSPAAFSAVRSPPGATKSSPPSSWLDARCSNGDRRMRPRLLLLPFLIMACKGADTIAPVSGGGGPVPLMGHVIVVVEENTDYSSVIGSSSMPYLNGLAQQYALATKYYAVTHPSIGNYFMMTVGKIITNDDSYSGVVSDDNIVRRLSAAGKTWKSYAEDLPSVGYTGGDAGNYARKHNVIALLSDVVNSATQRDNLVPFSQFATDLANGTQPDFSNIVPNLCNDAHDCSLTTADTWLRNNIAPLIASPT